MTPLDRVGVYVPGGQAAYPSTVLMTAIPARVAGVGEVIMTVPTPDGVQNDLVLAAAHIAGVDRAFTVGGAQAVAALAIGTGTIPKVDKIVGPGGVFVAAAKRLVFGEVGIDMVAGPSEVLVIADGNSPVDWIVYDLFSQAEHDEAAQALLLCPDADYLDAVAEAMTRHLANAPRQETICASLNGRGALIQVADLAEAMTLANRIAPEHLELHIPESVENGLKLTRTVRLAAPAGTLSTLLQDVSAVASCIPGAELTSPADNDPVQGHIAVAIGPMAARFDGVARVHYNDDGMSGSIIGRGRDQLTRSQLDSALDYVLRPLGEVETELHLDITYRLSGLLAQVGRPAIVQQIADSMLDETASRLTSRATGTTAESPAQKPLSALGLLLASLRRLFSGASGVRPQR